ncbi:MAG TPA: hypothetical protein PKA19_07990 [Bacillota bacterium]|nr:hypothetical protein [Bacillota bacterium]
MNACEGLQPCDGSVTAAAEEEDREDCAIGGVDRPDCRCSASGGTSSCGNNNSGVGCGCNNNISDARDHCGHRNGVLGDIDRHVLEKLLEEIADELANDCDGVAGIGFGPGRPRGCGCRDNDRVAGASECLRDEARSASRFHGPNGCSW